MKRTVLSVKCPLCEAKAGEHCRGIGGSESHPHFGRKRNFAKAEGRRMASRDAAAHGEDPEGL